MIGGFWCKKKAGLARPAIFFSMKHGRPFRPAMFHKVALKCFTSSATEAPTWASL